MWRHGNSDSYNDNFVNGMKSWEMAVTARKQGTRDANPFPLPSWRFGAHVDHACHAQAGGQSAVAQQP